MLTYGPDVVSSCAAEFGRVLELGGQYLVGIGANTCGVFHDWTALSGFTEDDLDLLRDPTVCDTGLQLSTSVVCCV